MEKRLPLALFLSLIIVIGWSILFPSDRPEVESGGGSGSTPVDERPAQSPGEVSEAQPAETAEPIAPVLEAAEAWDEVLELGRDGEQGHYLAHFDNRGGRLRSLRLGGYWDRPNLTLEQKADPEHWVGLMRSVRVGEAGTGSLMLRAHPSTAKLVAKPLDLVLWEHEVLTDGSGVTTGVEFRHAPGTGIELRKRITFEPNSFDVRIELGVKNSGTAEFGRRQFLFTPAEVVPASGRDNFYTEPSVAVAWRRNPAAEASFESIERDLSGSKRSGNLKAAGQLAFIGVHSKYFASILREGAPAEPAMIGGSWRAVYDKEWVARHPGEENEGWRHIVADVDIELTIPRTEGEEHVTELVLFAGPKQREIFEADFGDHILLTEEDLGFFASIARFLLLILGFFQGLTGNWGWSIILLTLTVRTVLFPVNRRSQTAMARHAKKMKRVQPKLEEIKERHKNDKRKQQQEQARIMQEEGAFPPLGGCLPVFVQIPIFFGLFSALRTNFDLRHAGFHGWIQDLSQPDRLMRLDFNTHLPFIGTIEYLNVLPPLMVVLWILQQRTMPKPTDPQAERMQKMMMWMPVMMGFFLYNYPAGLSLYMITQSGMGIFEQAVIKKLWPVDDTEQPRKKSAFMAKLSKMQEQAQRMQEDQARTKRTGKDKGSKGKGKGKGR